MTTLEISLLYALILSIAANAFGIHWYLRRRKMREPDVTASEILHHLTRGTALIQIECIDPSSLWMRRPGS
jgi:hypothetical protein